MDDLGNIVQALLEMKVILFLPSSFIVSDPTKFKDYFGSIDSKTLLYLVKELNVGDIEPIQKIFGGPVINNPPQIPNATNQLMNNLDVIKPDLSNMKDYHYYNQFLQMNNDMEKLNSNIQRVKNEIEVANTQLSQFKCVDGLDNMENDFISNFILDCSKFSVRNIDWFKVILKIDLLDDQFENEVVKRLTELNINFDYNVLKPYLDLLQNNTELKKMFEMRLIDCSKDPYSFWDNLSGSVSFESLSECNLCHNDCILYLNDSYKSFLMTDIQGIDVTNKLKVLVFCEHRLFQFSKHLSLEAIRIKGKKYTKVKNILKSLDKKSHNKVFMKNKAEEKNIENQKKLKDLELQQQQLQGKMGNLVGNRDMEGGAANIDPQPVQQPVQQQQQNYVYDEVIPKCDGIANDIKNGRIKQKNFMYLSNRCNDQINNSLK